MGTGTLGLRSGSAWTDREADAIDEAGERCDVEARSLHIPSLDERKARMAADPVYAAAVAMASPCYCNDPVAFCWAHLVSAAERQQGARDAAE